MDGRRAPPSFPTVRPSRRLPVREAAYTADCDERDHPPAVYDGGATVSPTGRTAGTHRPVAVGSLDAERPARDGL